MHQVGRERTADVVKGDDMALPVLGIDIAKAKFDAYLLLANGMVQRKVLPNTPTGFALLTRWLGQHTSESVHACLEATGTYGAALALHLHAQHHVVSLINPAAIKGFAASRLTRSKTDRVDASLIARFCATQHPPAWTPPAPEVQALQGLVRRLDALVEMRTMERNRLSAGETLAAVRASIEAHLAYLQQEIAQTERLIQQHLRQHTVLQTQLRLLLSIPGIGAATAALLLAEINFAAFGSARQVAAFVGVVPRLRQSGSSVRGRSRLSKLGSSRVRHALYFPAVTALRCSPEIQAWADGLRARGKCEMQIIGAVMRKLVHLAFGVLKSGRPYDPTLA
ncbi:MAG: IS110 family transposase [Chloroflexota bacterium]|nr:IS110 family transposase [Chloroflexota bacterium]